MLSERYRYELQVGSADTCYIIKTCMAIPVETVFQSRRYFVFSGTAKINRNRASKELFLPERAFLAIHSKRCPVSIFCHSAVAEHSQKSNLN